MLDREKQFVIPAVERDFFMIIESMVHQDQNIQHEGNGLFKSLRLRPECLANLKDVSKIIFIGSSATGKSHIQRAVISASNSDGLLSGKIIVPRRIVTRPLRPDDGKEIIHRSSEELKLMASNGMLGLYGIKTMEDGRTELFGLEKPEAGKLPIFFANNVIVKKPQNIQPKSLFEQAFIIGMYTPDDQREIRLRQRSPELFQGNASEAKFRLSEEESSRIVIPISHVIVKNFGNFESMVERDVIKLLQLVVLSREKKLLTEITDGQLKNHYIVLRHGKSVANAEGLIMSQPNKEQDIFGITSEGEDQIRLAAYVARNSGIKIDTIITSPLKRCTDSASNFAQAYGFYGEIKTRSELRERDFGIFDGRPSINYRTVYSADQDSPRGSIAYRAETPGNVLKRVTSLITEIEETNKGKTILLVTHADVGEITQAGLHGLPPETHRFFIHKLRNGQLRAMA